MVSEKVIGEVVHLAVEPDWRGVSWSTLVAVFTRVVGLSLDILGGRCWIPWRRWRGYRSIVNLNEYKVKKLVFLKEEKKLKVFW